MQNPSKRRHLLRTSCLQARHNRSALTVERFFSFGNLKGDWSNRHVEKDPYPNGRSARRHQDQLLVVNFHSLRLCCLGSIPKTRLGKDGPTDFRENTYPEAPPEMIQATQTPKKRKSFQCHPLGSGTSSTSQGPQGVSKYLKSYDPEMPPFSGYALPCC